MLARSIAGVDRSRKVPRLKITRKPAPMLMPHTLTVEMTVKILDAMARHILINSLEG